MTEQSDLDELDQLWGEAYDRRSKRLGREPWSYDDEDPFLTAMLEHWPKILAVLRDHAKMTTGG